ncbi:hypothetical protein [Streptomyces nigrescens]|uniref:Uncharacterized protein n=1 Tax=Streptomyces nigrescens TaxID=1920 RepID=A0A640T8L7_STRNI|nr:hypothetical protein [Streptomyces libani]WAT94940.1 hypothetical protein STRLI_000612 [Streptomyces libani subsp. libani]GFE20089.1 hypothetical protein Sliba_05420 [Streptomyces libani subsp. libani]GGV85829.1 hypothetical protein GCM10010500_02950 [Streptomyces libani subsp. libani]
MTDHLRQRLNEAIDDCRTLTPEALTDVVLGVVQPELEQLRNRAAELEEQVIAMGGHQAAVEEYEARLQALTEATVVWRDRPGGDVGLAIALSGILDADKPEPPASAALVRILAECDRIEREANGQHDEDDDGMREAIRRIRAAAGAEQGSHAYLSTGCLHGEHGYCQAHTGLSGAKTPAQCKFCGANCQCPCHRATTAEEV